ncbi:MAG: hypothetical protein R3B06_07965 [Kofleriaceae bacterium]
MATPEEVRAALTPAVLRDTLALVVRRMGGPQRAFDGQTADDMVNDAVEATLCGTRPWPYGKALVLHLFDAALDRARWRWRMAERMTPLDPLLDDPADDEAEEGDGAECAPEARELALGVVSLPPPDDEFRARLAAVTRDDPELHELAWALQCGIHGQAALATFLDTSIRDVRKRYMRLRRAGRRNLAAPLDERIAS